MNEIKLGELAILKSGTNLSRLSKEDQDTLSIYRGEDFDIDQAYPYYEEDVNASINANILQTNDLVFNTATAKAVLVSKESIGKTLIHTYVKIACQHIDPRYLLYLLNEDASIRNIIEVNREGSNVVKRFPLKKLEQLMIPNIDSHSQARIGKAYLELLSLYQAKLKEADSLKELAIEKINTKIRKKEDN